MTKEVARSNYMDSASEYKCIRWLRSLTGPLTLLESNVHRRLISRVLGVFVVAGVRSTPRIFSGRIGPISRIGRKGPIGVLVVERVMGSPHADCAPRMASSVNRHWLGTLFNSEQPPLPLELRGPAYDQGRIHLLNISCLAINALASLFHHDSPPRRSRSSVRFQVRSFLGITNHDVRAAAFGSYLELLDFAVSVAALDNRLVRCMQLEMDIPVLRPCGQKKQLLAIALQ